MTALRMSILVVSPCREVAVELCLLAEPSAASALDNYTAAVAAAVTHHLVVVSHGEQFT